MMSILYTSQLLADSLVAIVTVMDTGLLSVAMLQYVLHNYATYVQVGKSVFELWQVKEITYRLLDRLVW